MPSSIYQFLKSPAFFRNLLILLFAIVGGFFVLTSILNSYTHHGENIAVPDLRGIRFSKLDSILVTNNFHFKVIDSLYDGDKKPGTILDQDPSPNSKVKENRTIYITINSTQPPDVKMPDLVDVSFRQAEAMLQSFGLVTGDIIYRSDLAKNAVLEQRYNNRTIKPGTLLPKGAVIDLVLGDGIGDIDFAVPDLLGLTLEEALSLMKSTTLSITNIQYDNGLSDTLSAKIYFQNPSPNIGLTLKQGDGIEIFLR